jgi:hypothetical protein
LIPKAALFVVARQLAAQVTGRHDKPESFDVLQLMYREWFAQWYAGNVPQKPPKALEYLAQNDAA